SPRFAYSHERSGVIDQSTERPVQTTSPARRTTHARPARSQRGHESAPHPLKASRTQPAASASAPIQTREPYDDPSPAKSANATRTAEPSKNAGPGAAAPRRRPACSDGEATTERACGGP